MKVAVDLTPLYSAHQFRGIGFYTKRLMEAMEEIAPQRGIELEFVKSTDKLFFVDADVIHFPYFSPFFLTLPRRKLTKSVVTIHDLIPIKYLQHYPPGIRGRLRWEIQKRRLKKVEAVITDSDYWREEIPKLTSYPKEKIFVVPLAAGKEFKKLPPYQVSSIKHKYNLPDNFVLYVGDVNWNKNVEGLIKALAKSKIQNSKSKIKIQNLKLVLVGKAFEDKSLKETKEILQLIKQLNLINQTKILGYVPTEDLVAIYNLATVFCLPSFSEGFGLPALEAMACGCPVVAGKTSSLPEICGQAAVLVDPYDVNDIARGIIKAIENKENLIESGFKQAAEFSWEKTANLTLEVYEKAWGK
jgi:glycosyltransferase involved in cell wall biosynthesis